ncbi:hypothetical protein AArcCO_0115 [Halalkaliarchaeum sp. AArc-CO]|uniref:DUF7537 family lipoprotein n=1 Tax=unclassified Halalkaliarchaeum TaxID=2678344 RepID=UPI00217E2BF2|nr:MULTISPECIES: hypothetical protein [unclassified Halalkaliarchaeum]MDR5672648.1 hypothetical protein [Halalkaliarchaeum sp. AArc-GB]UWG49447.1 hypothetical protein AArcCO_0115 [Halalkaliarchaeum sp. AArc-CO]
MARVPDSEPRRWFLHAVCVASVAGLAGCSGDEPDPDDVVGEDPADDPPEDDTTSDDDSTPDDSPAEDDDPQVEIAADIDPHVSETWVRQEQPDGRVVVNELYTEWDTENDRVYRRVETTMENDETVEVPVMEYYVVGETTYQLRPDGCVSFDGRLIRRDELREANVRLPDVREIETDDDAEYLGPDVVDGRDVDVWRFTPDETFAHDGEMTVAVEVATGHVLLIESWYETGHGDNPVVIRFEQRNHSFGESFEIEPPEECES